MKFNIELVKRVKKHILKEDTLEFVANEQFDFGNNNNIIFGKTILDKAMNWLQNLKIAYEGIFIQICPDRISLYLRSTDKVMFDGQHVLLVRTDRRYSEDYFIDTCNFRVIYDPITIKK